MNTSRPLRILTFSSLFPNAVQPQHGIFVETRLRHVVATGQIESRVVAPAPWFPFSSQRFGEYGQFARIPRAELRHGISISHPRYVVVPRVGMLMTPGLMYRGARATLRRLIAEGFDFDLIDAHYFYPDGVAAALLAREFGKPFTVTARGTDLNLIPQYALPRRMITWTARRAQGLITVCSALRDPLVELGIPEDRVTVLRNGVDLELFKPQDRQIAREKLGEADWKGPLLLSVGHLIERKGHHLTIEALVALPDARLLIAGSGSERSALEKLAARLGVSERVRFLGQMPQAALPALYSAADIFVLASSREGWANVLLEAMACGTPVAASNIWGTPEVVAAPEAGRLMPELTPAGVAAAVSALQRDMPDRIRTRRYAEQFSWNDTTNGQLRLFQQICHRS